MISITETLSKIVTVRAQSMESSLSEAHDNYSDAKSGYVLDYSDLRGVTLSMVGIHREKAAEYGWEMSEGNIKKKDWKTLFAAGTRNY